LYVFRSTDLSASLNTLNLDVSPTLLIPYYDEDSATLFLTGKVNQASMKSFSNFIFILSLRRETPQFIVTKCRKIIRTFSR
jgi:hypothetical protein